MWPLNSLNKNFTDYKMTSYKVWQKIVWPFPGTNWLKIARAVISENRKGVLG